MRMSRPLKGAMRILAKKCFQFSQANRTQMDNIQIYILQVNERLMHTIDSQTAEKFWNKLKNSLSKRRSKIHQTRQTSLDHQ